MSLQLGSSESGLPKKYDSSSPSNRGIKHKTKDGKDSMPEFKKACFNYRSWDKTCY